MKGASQCICLLGAGDGASVRRYSGDDIEVKVKGRGGTQKTKPRSRVTMISLSTKSDLTVRSTTIFRSKLNG